jgi:tetratricopeptide (TPR) repeat protein
MADDAVEGEARYWAFISYSHRDAEFGRRLHRRLEGYALPGRLVGRGGVPRRLSPIFRDRDELPAADDLSTEVRQALAASRSLLVVCSPRAAASKWVEREISVFRALHPDRPVLAALVRGELADAMPSALRRIGPDGEKVEPLAADFRRGGDGTQLGLLKLVAGIAGIRLDELIQRDAHRHIQRVTAVTASAVVAMLAMAGLTLLALRAQSEAERQRREAEGLIDFMHADLRPKLQALGRLDLMGAVNSHALRYYERENLAGLSGDSLERRARILHDIGEDDITRGDEPAAFAAFDEAGRTTAALLAAEPDIPDRIFDHAQSEYWIGYHHYLLQQYPAASAAFRAYKALAQRLLRAAPNDPRGLRELGYSEMDLCSVALKPPKNLAEALQECTDAIAHTEAAYRAAPSSEVEAEVANEHAWLADAYRSNRDNPHAIAQRLIQKAILDRLLRNDPHNMVLWSYWITMQRVLARMEAESGHHDAALARLTETKDVLDRMIAFDPKNHTWTEQRAKLSVELSRLTPAH